jgi:hypothetical protein
MSDEYNSTGGLLSFFYQHTGTSSQYVATYPKREQHPTRASIELFSILLMANYFDIKHFMVNRRYGCETNVAESIRESTAVCRVYAELLYLYLALDQTRRNSVYYHRITQAAGACMLDHVT